MTETRRDLFTGSVITAIGLTAAAGAVGGAVGSLVAGTAPSPRTSAAPAAGSVVAVHDYMSNIWYVFYFASNSADCSVYKIQQVPVSEASVDTTSWYATASKNAVVTTTTIYYKTGTGTGHLTLNFDGAHVSDNDGPPSSLTQLVGLVKSADTSYQQIPGSWNEIGKQ